MRTSVLIATALLLLSTPAAADPPRPNIIVIMADDLGYGDIGVHGQATIQTPSIDSLADEGLRFTNAYAGNPICAPSRCALMTGLHVGHCTVHRNAGPNLALRVEDATVAEILRGAGYTSAIWGKWGLGGEAPKDWGGGELNVHSTPLARGFDHSFVYRGQGHAWFYYPEHVWLDGELYPIPENADDARVVYTHDLFAEDVLAWVTEHAYDPDPFYMQLSYTIPHARVEVPDLEPYGDEEWPWIEQTFAAMITRLDTNIGDLVTLLDDLGIAEQTLILFTSDNGPHEAETDGEFHDAEFFDSAGGLRGHKHDLFEGGIHVPLIARWPGTIDPGGIDPMLVSHIDFLPTAAELAGVAAPSDLDGLSLAPTLTGDGTQQQHGHLFWQHDGDVRGADEPLTRFAVRRDDSKYVETATGEAFLFDLTMDPAESADISADHPHVMADLRGIVTAESTGPLFPVMPRLIANGDAVADAGLPADDPAAVPVLWLRFDGDGPATGEPAGTVLDSAADLVSAAEAFGEPLYDDDVFGDEVPASGEPNAQCLRLDGSGAQHVSVPHHPALSLALASFTLEAWVRLDGLASGTEDGDRQWLAIKKELDADDSRLNYGVLAQAGSAVHRPSVYGKTEAHTGRELALLFGNSNASVEGVWAVVSTLEIDDLDWHHLSVTHDAPAAMVRFELDGEVHEVGIESHGFLEVTGPLTVGARPTEAGDAAEGLHGAVDELRFSRGVVPLDELLSASAVPAPADPPTYVLDLGEVELGGDAVERTFTLHHAATAYAHLLVGEVTADRIDDPRLAVSTGAFGPMADGGATSELVVTLDPTSAGPLVEQTIDVEGRALTYAFHALGSPLRIELTGEVVEPAGDDDDTTDDDDDTSATPDDDDTGTDGGCECSAGGGPLAPPAGLLLVLLALARFTCRGATPARGSRSGRWRPRRAAGWSRTRRSG